MTQDMKERVARWTGPVWIPFIVAYLVVAFAVATTRQVCGEVYGRRANPGGQDA